MSKFTCLHCITNDRKDLHFTTGEAWTEHIKQIHGFDLSTRPPRPHPRKEAKP